MTRKITVGLAVRLIGAVAFLNLFALAAFGQTGSITGGVFDPSGAAVATGSIDAKNVATGALFSSGASSTGNYVIRVPAGTYELTVESPGFKKYVRSNVLVQTASDTRMDVNLEVGSTTDTITVTEATPMLKTESGEMSHIVTTAQVNQLPVITIGAGQGIRDPLQQIVLLPGTTYANGNAVVVNGMPANSESIRIEGQDSTGNIWKISQQNSQAGLDAIQEVAIQTSNFAAEYGQAAGGYINYTMKSGTNAYHGSAYDYIANEGLNAGLPFTDRCQNDGAYCTTADTREHVRNRVRRTDYGFTFGGPVRIPKLYDGRNRSFFFVNFEQYRTVNSTSTSLINTPTTAYRAGDFSAARCNSYTGGTLDGTGGTCVPFTAITQGGQPAVDPAGNALVQGQIYDPYSTRLVNGTQVRTPYVNNQMPVSSMDPVALAVQKLMPAANRAGTINNYAVPTWRRFTHTTNLSFKFDQNISSTIKLSAYYSQINNRSPFENGLPRQLGGADTNNWNHTTRLGYDQTITPTLLLHIGVGYFHTSQPNLAPAFDQSTIGLKGYEANQIFPDIGGVNSGQGGYSGSLGATFSAIAYEQKPTATTSLTWVKGNHTLKMGGEFTGDGFPTPSSWRVNGNFGFSPNQTANPFQDTVTLNVANPTGFAYASFLTGLPNTLNLNAPNSAKLGYHSMGFYLQDTWKVSRKFTLDYGLRYDYQTYMTEQYGRMQNASFGTFDKKLGRNGAVIYGQTCNCEFSHNYPFAFGPRLGGAYQIDTKTVIRGGAGLQYNAPQAPNGFLYSAADYYQINPNGYGISPMQNTANPAQNGLQGGNPYATGNPFGNQKIVWPNLDQDKYPFYNNGIAAPGTPVIFFDNHNRPGRVVTWSLAVQREVTKDLVVEVAYVGNRGAYFAAPQMSQVAQNGLTPAMLAAQGIDMSSATDRALLTSQVGSAAVQARFPQFRTVSVNGTQTVPSVYAGFPAIQQLAQALRSTPQWGALNPQLGPPMGKTWYDSLQAKVTKRYSHGLTLDANLTWAHGMVIGSASDSTFFLGGQTTATDIYNFDNNKQLNQYVRPLASVLAVTYTTPRLDSSSSSMRMLSHVLKDWQIGAVLRYQSGALLANPTSLNLLTTQLVRAGGNFGLGATNFWNYTGQDRYTVTDPNCKCFDPQQAVVFSKAAWTDAPGGQWSTSAPYYNNFRWQRQPSENMNFGRNFRVKEGMTLFIRAEFTNVFNRTFLSQPSSANPNTPVATTTYVGQVINNTGFGSISTLNGAGSTPRAGTIVARFTF
ncbi:MAG: TonB-dependent receptor [Bryobacteraceae bacterium]